MLCHVLHVWRLWRVACVVLFFVCGVWCPTVIRSAFGVQGLSPVKLDSDSCRMQGCTVDEALAGLVEVQCGDTGSAQHHHEAGGATTPIKVMSPCEWWSNNASSGVS